MKQLKLICEREGVTAEEEALHIIGQKAEGAMRDALSIFDRIVSFTGNNITYKDVIQNLNILDYDYYFKITQYILSEDIPATLLLFNDILSNGFDGLHFLTGLSDHLRNLSVCKYPDTVKLLEVASSVAAKYAQQSQTANISFLLNALNMLNKCELDYKSSKNQRLHVELCLMKLCHLKGYTQLESTNLELGLKKKLV